MDSKKSLKDELECINVEILPVPVLESQVPVPVPVLENGT